VDHQNQERLKQCVAIEDALSECERIRKLVESSSNQKDLSSPELHPKIQLHDSRAGMKIARFYGWGLRNPKAEEAIDLMRGNNLILNNHQLGTDSEESKNANVAKNEEVVNSKIINQGNKNITVSCSKEHHALWGCRAMALGCAKELIQLKKCFNENQLNNDPQYFCYDKPSSSPEEVCSLSMRKLGECVSIKLKALNERIN
jgi:hypothetical protein